MKIVTLGGTGLIGAKLVKLLRSQGHEITAASPSLGINSITGEGLSEALTRAQVVVDVTTAPSWEDKAVLEFFETSTRNLLAVEGKSGDASAPPNMSQPRFSTFAQMTQCSRWEHHSLSMEASSRGAIKHRSGGGVFRFR
jgi:uncharacterized protein YbjT (DUF2867 family)